MLDTGPLNMELVREDAARSPLAVGPTAKSGTIDLNLGANSHGNYCCRLQLLLLYDQVYEGPTKLRGTPKDFTIGSWMLVVTVCLPFVHLNY